MLSQFKQFKEADGFQMDDLIAMAAFGRQLREEYESHQLDEPDYIDHQLKAIRREIQARNADNLEKRKREIKSRLETLKSPTQRKKELEAELKEINSQLAPA